MIQNATVSDVRQIKKLLFETWSEVYKDVLTHEQLITVTSDWHSPDLLKKQIKDQKILFFVVKEGNKIVATCNTGEINTKEVEIQRLHVKPGYQRQGLGTTILDHVIESFPKHHKFRIEVEETNSRAVAFYKKYGFRKTKKIILEIDSIKIPCIEMILKT